MNAKEEDEVLVLDSGILIYYVYNKIDPSKQTYVHFGFNKLLAFEEWWGDQEPYEKENENIYLENVDYLDFIANFDFE